jgi:F-type H+-transporting ATPase subunit alpha
MATRGQDIASAIKREINKFGTSLAMYDVGVVSEIGDGIARINGLASAKYNELLQFPNDTIGIAMNLEEDSVAAIILGDYAGIKEGDEVRCTGRIAEVPVGEALIGRVVDPLGRPLDGKGPIKTGQNPAAGKSRAGCYQTKIRQYPCSNRDKSHRQPDSAGQGPA